jgi:hypothetical protein
MTQPNLDVFKDIISIDEVEQQILVNLENWMPTYFNEVCRQRSFDPANYPVIRSWVTLQKFRHEPQNQTPAIVLINAGSIGRATKNGEGWWRTTFVFAISAIISARDEAAAADTSKLYEAAVRAIMLQKRAGYDMVSDVSWVGVSFDAPDVNSPDMLAAATSTFEIVCDGLVKSIGAGPLAPILTTPDPLPVVVEDPGRITVTRKE